MINDAPPEIQKVIDQGTAKEIAAYITKRNERRKGEAIKETTLTDVCKRFRLRQADAMRIIEDNSDVLMLSEFAYKPADKSAEDQQDWGKMLLAAFHPQHWANAPLGKRLVYVVEGEAEA